MQTCCSPRFYWDRDLLGTGHASRGPARRNDGKIYVRPGRQRTDHENYLRSSRGRNGTGLVELGFRTRPEGRRFARYARITGSQLEESQPDPLEHIPSRSRNDWLPSRRQSLLLMASSLATWQCPIGPGGAAATAGGVPFLGGSPPRLAARLTSEDLRNPGTAVVGPSQLYYPDWLFGAWHVTAKFVGFSSPLGERFVSDDLLREVNSKNVGLGSTQEYEAKFYSTLADTWQNQVRVALGNLPESRIVADRAANARQSETAEDGDFLCSELFRRVSIGVRREEVSDSEAVYRFHPVSSREVRARKRRAVYLQPQEPLFFEAWNRAVCLFDYDIVMTKPEGADDCVETPKEVIQCIGSL